MATAEYEFYAASSGLPRTATLEEHRIATYRAALPGDLTTDTLQELEMAWLRSLVTDTPEDTLQDLRFRYFASVSGLAEGTLVDHMAATFAGGGTPPPAPLSYEYADTAGDVADLTTYTFTGRAIGAAAASRRVVVAVTTNSTRTVNAVTIGGVAATIDATHAVGGAARLAYASAVVPTGATADVVVTLDAAGLGCDIVIWALGTSSFVASATSGSVDPLSMAVDTQTGDAVLATVFESGVSAATFAWTGATERVDRDAYSVTTHLSAADVAAAGVSTVIAADASSGTNQGGLAVAYRAA
jgi:hypothetical protein